jgi:pimeloyl-ACP methyl ester carboxylesterase
MPTPYSELRTPAAPLAPPRPCAKLLRNAGPDNRAKGETMPNPCGKWAALAILGVLWVMPARAAETVEMQEFMVPAVDPGIELYVRNKHPAGVAAFAPERILVYVHGATYPAETAFDLPVDGSSMMDKLAERGWDVWMLDVRGYSRSTRPPEMDRPAKDSKPMVDTATAAKDVGAVVDFVMHRRAVPKVNLMGWSWGTSIMGLYTTTHNANVARLVLYAPQWLSTNKVPEDAPPLGGYREVTRAAAKDRWLMGVPEDKKADLIPPGWFDQWADATFATDPAGAKQNPPVLRATNGVAQDSRDYWMAGKPLYQPSDITVPTLLIHAEWDADLPTYQTAAYFQQLTHAPYKRWVQLGEGTHTVMLEKNRMQFINAVVAFLEEKDPQALK